MFRIMTPLLRDGQRDSPLSHRLFETLRVPLRLPFMPSAFNIGGTFLLPFLAVSSLAAQQRPAPPGKLVDIGGQLVHVNCTGTGSPTVLLESGTGDFSVIWARVQPKVSQWARVCSYDRGGYAWSQPGRRPRTFAQLALELHTALQRLQVGPPFILVGQSYGGLVVRGFAAAYPTEVAGMVLVDAVHEDEQVVYGGAPHRIRDAARGRPFPDPRIALDSALATAYRDSLSHPTTGPLEAPLDRLPPEAQSIWHWAEGLPLIRQAQGAELDWSPEEFARFHKERLQNRATLGELPLIVLARTDGEYPAGMSITPEALERERRSLMADLAGLSHRGKLRFARHSGHNIHLEDPGFVITAIHDVTLDAGSTR